MNSKTVRYGAKAAGVVAASTIAIGFLSAGVANADTFVPLKDGEVTQTLIDGTVVTVKQTGNSALISPSMGATPLHRNVWASGSIDVDISGDTAEGGKIDVGYIVACQFNFGGETGVEGGALLSPSTNDAGETTIAADPGGETAGGVTIGPGEAKAVSILDIEQEDDYGQEEHVSDFEFEGNSGGITYSDETFAVSGCAGYAQARSYVKVEVSTDRVDGTVTLWGQPFSLG